jgi:ribonuclease P protein component
MMAEEYSTDYKKTFSKGERLCSTKSIEYLFAKGDSFIAYPLRVVYLFGDEDAEDNQFASVLISVSKRKFKRAVKRNRVKRLMREAYRLNKLPYLELLRANNKRMDIAFLYLKDELPTYGEIEKAIQKAVSRLKERMEGITDK